MNRLNQSQSIVELALIQSIYSFSTQFSNTLIRNFLSQDSFVDLKLFYPISCFFNNKMDFNIINNEVIPLMRTLIFIR